MHIPKAEPGGRGHRVVDQRRAIGNARHAQAGGVQFQPGALVMRGQDRAGIVAHANTHTKSRRHRIGGDVVMRGANAARGEDMIVTAPQRVQRGHDARGLVGHDAHFFQVNAHTRQFARKVMHIGVARAPRTGFHRQSRALAAVGFGMAAPPVVICV